MFGLRHVRPKIGFWTKGSYWTVEEAAALWLDCDPKFLNDGTIAPYLNDPIGDDYTERVFLLRRALEGGELQNPLTPWAVLQWADGLGPPLPGPLREAISEFERRRSPARGVRRSAIRVPAPASTIDPRFHRTLQKIVAVIAIDAYDYAPDKQRQRATSLIVSAFQRQGYTIDEATVLTHLRTCVASARDDEDDNPNSD